MSLHETYPWITPKKPVIVSAPMMKVSMGAYALSTSAAGGMGFLAGGFDLNPLKKDLAMVATLLNRDYYPTLSPFKGGVLPIGVGIQNWGSDKDLLLQALKLHPVAAVWFFAPGKVADFKLWADAVRQQSPVTKVWIQVGTVAEAQQVLETTKPDVLVLQGLDSGGHGLVKRASVISLLPEVVDMQAKIGSKVPLIAAGGIADGRGTAAAIALGADGVCMGTRFLASKEAVVAKGYQREVLRATDGGVSTVATTVYDTVRGIHGWPAEYDGRGIINQSYVDHEKGMSPEQNEALYKMEIEKGDEGWGPTGRMTTYAGTAVGLVKSVLGIEQIIRQTQEEALRIIHDSATKYL